MQWMGAGVGVGGLGMLASSRPRAAAQQEAPKIPERLAPLQRTEGKLKITDVKTILTAPARIRLVVVKVITPDQSEGVSAERFAREMKMAARLQQANIVPVLSTGVANGLPYYTMPFVAGESLRARLLTGIPVPIAEAVNILRDVARALAFAHAQRIVHRDIKPENILLSGGAAVVTDFGIAKAFSASRTLTSADSGTLTRAGYAVGTPAYMAPEQVAADASVDHRADLYAWGLVAWELLAGKHPFEEAKSGPKPRAPAPPRPPSKAAWPKWS